MRRLKRSRWRRYEVERVWENVRNSRENWGGVTAAMNGGAGEKTGQRHTVDVERRLYLSVAS